MDNKEFNEIVEVKQEKKKGKKGWLIIVVIFIVILGLSGISPPDDETEIKKVDENTQEIKGEEEEPVEEEPIIVSFGNGTHIVGMDIEPGTYRSEDASICYWARLSGFTGELDDIIANGNHGMEIVTIDSSDAAFKTSVCGKWVAVESTYPNTPTTSFSDGTYQAGEHIEAGIYRADGNSDDLCYWARLSDFSHSGVSGIITNGNSPTIIEILVSDAGFTTFGCGNWNKIQ